MEWQLIVVGVWASVAVAVALVLGRMIQHGHRNDPPISAKRTLGAQGAQR